MDDQPAVLQWARSVQLQQPVRWGEVEAGVLAREPIASDRLPVWVGLVGAVGWAWVGSVAVVTLGAAPVGLVLVVVGTSHDDVTGRGWFGAAGVVFVVACLVELVALSVWWSEGRKQQTLVTIDGGLALVSSGAAVVVLVAGGAASDFVRTTIAAGAAATSGVVLLALMAFSRPGGRARSRKPPRRGPRSAARTTRYLDTREAVLDVLADRGVVTLHEAERRRMREMPLGYWEELDGVDEREWRRILELRLVGWRDFGADDRRRWPPAAAR